MTGSDHTKSARSETDAAGRPVELTQSDIQALAKGGRDANEVRKRMEAESSAAGTTQSEQRLERSDGGKAVPEVRPPAESLDESQA